jgi:hypothetical protein
VGSDQKEQQKLGCVEIENLIVDWKIGVTQVVSKTVKITKEHISTSSHTPIWKQITTPLGVKNKIWAKIGYYKTIIQSSVILSLASSNLFNF